MKGSKGKWIDILRARESIHIRLLGSWGFFKLFKVMLETEPNVALLWKNKKQPHNVLIKLDPLLMSV